MRRTVTAHLQVDVTERALLALQVAVAGPAPDERLTLTCDGTPVPFREIDGGHGGRVHTLDAPVGHLVRRWRCTDTGARRGAHASRSRRAQAGAAGPTRDQLQPLVEPQPSHR